MAHNLPEVFDPTIPVSDQTISVYSFSFSEHDDVFRISDKEILTAQFDPYSFNPYSINIGEGLEYKEIPSHPTMIPIMGGLIIGPSLHSWAVKNKDATNSAIPIMKKVFTELHPFWDEDINSDLPEGGGHIGFDVRFREDGGLIFQVLGDCACFGPDPHSYIIRGQFEKGYAQYTLHNNDYSFQRTAIYAGVGHLAFLAGNESARQLKLF